MEKFLHRFASCRILHSLLVDSRYSLLLNYGIRGTACQWFNSYLNNRQQYTNINNVSYCLANVLCGVPQGSVLGPLLFLLYINDISRVLPGENVKHFC